MKKLFLSILNFNPILGEPNLLDRVKNNPNEAIKLCKKFKDLNAKGISANDDKAINYVANKKGFDPLKAEIYSIYVIGMHCPEVS